MNSTTTASTQGPEQKKLYATLIAALEILLDPIGPQGISSRGIFVPDARGPENEGLLLVLCETNGNTRWIPSNGANLTQLPHRIVGETKVPAESIGLAIIIASGLESLSNVLHDLYIPCTPEVSTARTILDVPRMPKPRGHDPLH